MTLTLLALIIAFQLLHIATDILAARSLSRSSVLYARARLDGNEVVCGCRLDSEDGVPPCRTDCQVVRVIVDGRRNP